MDYEQIVKELTETMARSKSNTHRLDRLEARLGNMEKLTEIVAAMQVELGHAVTMIGETKDAVKELQDRPVKWWETLAAAVIAAAAGYLVRSLGVI